MGRKKRIPKALPTIWHVSDELWELIHPILKSLDPPAKTGRKRTDPRAALDGIIYQMRTGCQWNVLPRRFGDDSSVHRTFQRWISLGLFDSVWALLIQQCEELGGVHWQWQAADAVMGKARLGGTTSGPTPQIGRKTG